MKLRDSRCGAYQLHVRLLAFTEDGTPAVSANKSGVISDDKLMT